MRSARQREVTESLYDSAAALPVSVRSMTEAGGSHLTDLLRQKRTLGAGSAGNEVLREDAELYHPPRRMTDFGGCSAGPH
jgi:hypothetical protein